MEASLDMTSKLNTYGYPFKNYKLLPYFKMYYLFAVSQLHDIGLKMETVTSADTGTFAHWSGTFLFQTVWISNWLLDGMFLSINFFIRHTPSTDNYVPGSGDMR